MSPTTGAPTLVLVPTELELARLEDQGGFPAGVGLVAIAGFGPIAAAARTSALLARLSPARVFLVGIAGSYDADALPIGGAAFFASVAIDGIGAGEGDALKGPPALGFPQWPGGAERPPIRDEVELVVPSGLPSARLLLTTCAASATSEQSASRKRRFPHASAEDMEGFGVALACALEGVPLSIVRGVSNVVGDREPARWRIPAALGAARELLLAALHARGDR